MLSEPIGRLPSPTCRRSARIWVPSISSRLTSEANWINEALASGTRGRSGSRSLIAPPYFDEARDRLLLERAAIRQRSVALAEGKETRDHVLAALCADDVAPERDADAAKATLPERHGLHDAEIVLRRPPTLDLNSGMK